EAISRSAALPLIIYNNPGRVGIDLSVSLLARLMTLPTVIGLKDPHPDMTRPVRLRQLVSKSFCLLSGDDPTASAYLAQEGDGCISVTANIAPRLCQALMTAWKGRDLPAFAALRDRLLPLHEALVAETNPCPVKLGVSLLGKCRPDLRLPLVPVSPSVQAL